MLATETEDRSTSKREFRLENEYHYNRSGAVRWIISHLLRYPYLPLIAIAAAVVNNFAYSMIQVFVGRAFDLISTPGWANQALLALATGVFLAAVAQGAMGLIRNYSTEFIAQRIERDSRDELYVSLLGKSQTFHGRQRIGDIMARATNDVRQLNFMFSPGLMLIMDAAVGIIVPIIVIAQVSLELLLVPALFLVAFGITLSDYIRQLNPVSMAQREQFGVMNSGLAETIAGIEVVKGNVQEREAQASFASDATEFRDYFVRQGEIQARYLPLLVFSVALAAGFLQALLMWQAGRLSLGQVVTYMGLLGVLRFPTFISIFSFNLVQLGIASAERILATIKTETELDENEAGFSKTIEGKVTFQNVSFGYGDADILENISFSARPGRTVAIVCAGRRRGCARVEYGVATFTNFNHRARCLSLFGHNRRQCRLWLP